MKKIACILALSLLAGAVLAQTADKPAAKAPVVALVAAIGDQVEIVRQREGIASNREPFIRQTFPINGQALNIAILRGLDRAVEEEEPQAQRVLLAWTTPPEVSRQLAKGSSQDREAIVMLALKEHLKSLPERANWDRIEAIVPSYFYEGVKGMGRKLSGIGFYVQPLGTNSVSIQPDGSITMDPTPEKSADHATIDPNTGDVGYSNTFIAPYMYFQRITFDAHTLDVIAKKRQFDNVKYADPHATAVDVGLQIPLNVMTAKLLEVIEQSAYTSVRGNASVTATTPQIAASAPH